MSRPLLLGAVAYDPKVVTIWDGFRAWLRCAGLAFDYVLYSNYERQVEDLVAGRIDVAWNSPLAWVRARRLAAAAGSRCPRSRCGTPTATCARSIVVRADSPVAALGDLRGTGRGDRRGGLAAGHAAAAVAAARRLACARVPTSPCGASTSASACTATTSAASGTPPARCSPPSRGSTRPA